MGHTWNLQKVHEEHHLKKRTMHEFQPPPFFFNQNTLILEFYLSVNFWKLLHSLKVKSKTTKLREDLYDIGAGKDLLINDIKSVTTRGKKKIKGTL